MTIRNFASLMTPGSVALVGASPEPASVGSMIAANLRAGGFAGPIGLVNPRHREIDGVRCHATIAGLPFKPDLVVVATPPPTVPALIAEAGAAGARAAVVITAGIRDETRASMLLASRPYCLRILGPNCLGLLIPGIGLNASFSHRMPQKGDLAFVSQSGALVTAMIDWAGARGIGFSHVVSLGDMADADFGDFLDYLATDVGVRAILLYMEQLTHAPKFVSAARRTARVKPVIVLKAGRNPTAAKAAMSHTGALAGSDDAYNALFRRTGVLRVKELEELFEAAELLSRTSPLAGERLLIVTNGGGAGVLAADTLADLGGTLAPLGAATRKALDAELPPAWSHANPVDIIGDAGPDRYAAAMRAALNDDTSDAILVMNCPTALASSEGAAQAVIEAERARTPDSRKQKALLAAWLGDGAAAASRSALAAAGIAAFETPAAAVRSFMQLVRYKRAQDELMQTPPSLAKGLQFDAARARKVIAGAIDDERTVLSEFEAKELLASYGIPVVETRTARDPDEVAAISAPMLADGSACVVKILSKDITHKSDIGGVRLGIRSAGEAREAAQGMLDKVRAAMPDARVQGFTVQPMVDIAHAHELIIGMSDDATVGPLMMFGAGGTAVEVVADTAHALPPLDRKLARQMMNETRVSRLLAGYRNVPPADTEAVEEALVRLSYLVSEHPQICEIDVNPLLAGAHGCVALDARVRIVSRGAARHAMAIRPYPVEWERRLELPGLGAVFVRPIRPEDEPLYDRFFAHVSLEDRRMRFFTGAPDLSHRLLARLTQIDYAREMAFVAINEGTHELMGVARLIADPDYTRAEFGIIVRTDLQGKGLGWRLMQQLIDYAKAEGLQELSGQVLQANTSMLRMCRELGFHVAPREGDAEICDVRLSIADAAKASVLPG